MTIWSASGPGRPRIARRVPATEPQGDERERELLWAACMLHDIGMSIDYDDHHKHSRYLILNAGLPGFEQHLKLHVTGCPNSCGQHWIADVGIEGKKIKVDGRLQDAYYFCVGGALGLNQGIARPIGYRCLANEVPDAIERLLRRYLDERRPGENLRQFFARHSDENLRESLAGEVIAAVVRDPSPGRVPR